MASYEQFDVVVVPFPFTDKAAAKRRPAVVLSTAGFNKTAQHSAMAMITSSGHSPWPLDVSLQDLRTAGLPSPSVVRMKLFTLDHRFVIRRAGTLGKADRVALQSTLERLLGD